MLLIFLLCALELVNGDVDFLCNRINKTCPSNTVCRLFHDSTKGVMITTCIKRGFCPDPEPWEAQIFGVRQCRRECEEDKDCPGQQRCCNDFFGCGKKCREPVPEYTCDHVRCGGEESCNMSGEPKCVNITCSPPCEKDFRCEMDVDPSCSTARCPLVHRCLPKQPLCAPVCTKGYSCVMAQATPCLTPPCPKVPQCKAHCDPYPPGVNVPACGVADMCTLTPRPGEYPGCPDGSVCCRTFCGTRCLPIKPW